MIKISADQYSDATESYSGFCTTCNKITNLDGVEPDARGYTCDECSEDTVMGVEEALMMGKITIS